MTAKELLERGVDAWNARDREAYLATYAENCVFSSPDTTGKGHETIGAFFDANLAAFPDNRVRLRVLAEDGETLAEEGVFTGTNTGPLPMPDGSSGPATGAALELLYVGIHTVRDGKIVETRMYWDQLAMLGQLGLLPPQ
jgi:steroid delta-isomerase-like uncharacterized protein